MRSCESGKSPTSHSVRVHAELAVVHRSLVQTAFQPLHHRRRSRQTEETLEEQSQRGCSITGSSKRTGGSMLPSLTSSLMPVLSSMWIHSWTGAAISLLLCDRCSCRGSPNTLWLGKPRGGPAGAQRGSEHGNNARARAVNACAAAVSLDLSEGSCLSAR